MQKVSLADWRRRQGQASVRRSAVDLARKSYSPSRSFQNTHFIPSVKGACPWRQLRGTHRSAPPGDERGYRRDVLCVRMSGRAVFPAIRQARSSPGFVPVQPRFRRLGPTCSPCPPSRPFGRASRAGLGPSPGGRIASVRQSAERPLSGTARPGGVPGQGDDLLGVGRA